MNTAAPYLATAATPTFPGMAILAALAIAALVYTVASTTRYMGALLAELVRAARLAVSLVLTLSAFIVVALALLIHH
jgi:hypothetical protein